MTRPLILRLSTILRRSASGLLFACAAAPVHAQAASSWLPAEHWTVPLLVRLHALGVTAGDPVVWLRTQGGASASLPPAYAGRLAAERHASVASGTVYIEAAARLTARDGVLRPGGFTLDREWIGPQEAGDAAYAGVRIRAATVPLRWLALTTEVSASLESVALEHATIGATAAVVDMWAGRRPVGYRPGAGGGLVLHALERFEGAGVGLARAVSLPLLGAMTGQVMAGRLARNGHVARPWLFVMRAHARPHPRFDGGATRAAVFGATGAAGVGVRELATVLVGANLAGAYADDQVASIDARWRPPLGRVQAEVYGEWGIHDIDARVFIDVPAFTLGVRLPRAADLAHAEVGIGVEHTQISGSCCGNPPWYHHFELADGWAANGALLGHPLGGQGREWRVTVMGASRDGGLLFEAAAALRTRGAENVFAPTRQGRALLFDIAADAHLAERLGTELRLLAERGDAWTELRSTAAVRWRL